MLINNIAKNVRGVGGNWVLLQTLQDVACINPKKKK
jgi:hypothetical protein